MKNQFNKEVIECCICTMPIQEEKATGWKYGNNAEPYGTPENNRCCNACNSSIVIPTRISQAMTQSINNSKTK